MCLFLCLSPQFIAEEIGSEPHNHDAKTKIAGAESEPAAVPAPAGQVYGEPDRIRAHALGLRV